MRNCKILSTAIALATLTGAPLAHAGPDAADYMAAAKLLEINARPLVRNADVTPHWAPDGRSFWYRRDTAEGEAYVRVDVEARTRAPLFDHAALARGLNVALPDAKPQANEHRLGLGNVTVSGQTLVGVSGITPVRCDLAAYTCMRVQPSAGAVPSPPSLPSPDGGRALFVRAHNLVVRDVASGRERVLTKDGAEYNAYASLPDSALLTIPRLRDGLALPPIGATWSPDGRYVIAPHHDERAMGVTPFVEHVPADGSRRPIHWPVRTALVGEENQIVQTWYVFDAETGERAEVRLPDGFSANLASDFIVGWNLERGQAFAIVYSAASRDLGVVRIDVRTGTSTMVVKEHSDIRVEANTLLYNRPNIVLSGDDLIWYSARSGVGRLYLLDAQTGAEKAVITPGAGVVQDIISVDSTQQRVYVTIAGADPGADPYQRHLYRASFDGTDVRRLTPEEADHHFDPPLSAIMALLFGRAPADSKLSPDGRTFIDTYSTVSMPPVSVLRSTEDGAVLMELEQADASALYATGWRAPSRERVMAADGKTPIYAVYYEPHNVRFGKRPVIDATYGGPQIFVAPRNFVEAYGYPTTTGEASLARLGFAVVVVDGRGTPGRDNAFRDAGYVEVTQVGIDDHIAAIKELARRHREIDPKRVGIYGWSWGGTFAAQALMTRPDFFQVGVAGAGAYDYAAMYSGVEPYVGRPVYEDGTHVRPSPNAYPDNWRALDVTAMAPNLKGNLLIIAAELDENAPMAQSIRLIAALTKANKPYDFLLVPGATHAASVHPYVIQRTWDYFVEHLLGQTPPQDVNIAQPAPISAE